MKKFLTLFMILILSLSSFSVFAEEEKGGQPETLSAHVIMAQTDTGRIMYEKAADEKAYPASTTKIMTALLAIENLDPTASATASETAINIDRDGSNMGILHNEVLTVEQLLYGLMVHSANDAANVLAEAVSGSIDAFVERMNQKAAELGMTGTHYANAHGYHDPDHYTTARDLLTLTTYAMKNELFRTIVATAQYEIPPTNKYTDVRILNNNNALINPMKGHRYLYDGAKGVKTGYTDEAGCCLVSYAERRDLSYLCVSLKGEVTAEGTDSFIDAYRLFNYGFNDFSLKKVSDVDKIIATQDVKWARGGEQALLSTKEPVSLLLPNNYDEEKLTLSVYTEEKTYAPVKKGDVLGRVEYFYDGTSIGSADLVVTKDVKRGFFKMIFGTLFRIIFSPWVMIPFALVVALLLFRSHQEEKKKRRAREKRRQEFKRDFYK